MKQDVRNVDGKIVGFIEDGVLCKKTFKKKHFMRILNGWGWDKKIFDENNFTEVKILDKDDDIMYVSQRQDWIDYGIHKNFGYGDQIILPLRHHEVRHRKQPKML